MNVNRMKKFNRRNFNRPQKAGIKMPPFVSKLGYMKNCLKLGISIKKSCCGVGYLKNISIIRDGYSSILLEGLNWASV